MRLKQLVPILLALISFGHASGVEPIVATPFDIRHDANEVLEDIDKGRGDVGVILQRAQGLLAAHGDSMIVHDEVCAPISEHIAAALKEKQLTKLFVQTYSGIAERRLQEALNSHVSEADIRTIALSYPGTPSAKAAWQHLANSAWDTGRIGQYLDYARRAQETADPSRAERYQAATSLMSPVRSYALPKSLDGLEEMWRIDLQNTKTGSAPAPLLNNRLHRRFGRTRAPVIQRFSLSLPAHELMAASDGRRFFIFDHLIGRVIGGIKPLGGNVMTPVQSRPVPTGDGFVAIGSTEDHAVLMALDRLGEVKWRANSPDFGTSPTLSAPIVLDNVVVIAAISFGEANGADLRAIAYSIDTGLLAWNTLITRIPIPRQMMWASSEYGMAAPAIAVHDGGIVVLSNNGLLARLGIDGNVNRLWSYATIADEFDDGFGKRAQTGRLGSIHSDGQLLAASPIDSPGVVFMLGPDDEKPRRFQGDGANGDVLDVRDGKALLGGVRNLALLDLNKGKADWAISFSTGKENVQGIIGAKTVMIGTNEQLVLLDRESGRVVSSRGLGQGMSLALTPDLVMAATSDRLISWGRGESFLERLTTAAAANPKDYRPWGTLASYYDSRGEQQKAFSSFIEALQRGAPVDYVERAARLVREELELNAGNIETFNVPMTKLQALAAYNDHIAGEVSLWFGRDAELRGEKEQAKVRYKEALKGQDYRMLLKDRIEVSIHTLAQAGLDRINGTVATVAKPVDPPPAVALIKPWRIPGQLGDSTVVIGDRIIGFRDGFLSAINLVDGTLSWRRQPIRQILGVQYTNNSVESPDGLPISNIVPGSSAAGAGMQDGDVILSFQGKKTTNFERDLRGVLATMQPAMPFTMTVKRAGKIIELKGVLGGEPLEPIAGNDRTVLAWLTSPLFNTHLAQKNIPEGMWFSVLDAKTGKEKFRYSLPPTNSQGEQPTRPLLTQKNLILTQEANDLVCLPADPLVPGEAPAPLWKLPLGENGMSQMRFLTDDLLWLPEDGHNRIHIVNLTTGKTIYVLPEDLAADPILEQNACFCLGQAGRLTCWDLGMGRMRWKTEKVYGRLHAVSGDAIYVSDDQNQLVVLDAVNGEVRRRYGDWSTLEGVVRDGDHLCIFVRRMDRSQALVRVSLHGGHIVWQQTLPPGLEVQQLLTTRDAFGALLSDDKDIKTLLMVDKEGAIRTACRIEDNDRVIAVDGAVLGIGDKGIRVLPTLTPETKQPLVAQQFPAEKKLSSLYVKQKDKLQWQKIGAGAYAIGNQKGALVVFAKLGADGESLNLRIADGEDPIDFVGQKIAFTPTHPQFTGGGAWVVDQVEKISGDDEPVVLGIRLLPAPERLAGKPLSVIAQYGPASEAEDAPWWLRLQWRPVAGGP